MKTITVAGGDLYRLAARFYRDASLWTVIAQANGLSDPFFSGSMTLKIPNVPQ